MFQTRGAPVIKSGIRAHFRKISRPVSGRTFEGIQPDKYFDKWLHISDENFETANFFPENFQHFDAEKME